MNDPTLENDKESHRLTVVAAGALLVLDAGLVALGEHTLHEHIRLGAVFYAALVVWTLVNVGVVATVAYLMRRSFALRDRAIREVNERLMTTTEELEVANEELQTRAEELESSNEELLVTTEDLSRVNVALESRAEELETARASASAGRKYRDAILAAVPDVLIVVDGEKRLTTVNAACGRWLRRSEDNTLGKRLDEIPELAPLCGGEVAKWIDVALESGGRDKFTAVEFGEGDVRHIFDIEVIGFRAGASPEALVLMEDVTERALFRAKESLLAALVEASGEAVIGLDGEGRIISWNPAARDLFGYAAGEILGRPASGLGAGHRFEEQLRRLAPSGKETRVTFDAVGKHASGRELALHMCVTQLGGSESVPFGYAAIVRDVGRQKRADKEHETTTELLRLLARGFRE